MLRIRLQDILNQTSDYPDSLTHTIATLRESVPPPPRVPTLVQMQDSLASQDRIIESLAEKLLSLKEHDDSMDEALKDSEAGEVFSEEDLQGIYCLLSDDV